MSVAVYITKEDGSIINNAAVIKAIAGRLNLLKNGEYELSITPKKERRNNGQNSLFHMWIAVIADNVGYTSREDCKTDVKRHILGMQERTDLLTGEVVSIDFKTSFMSKADMSVFMEKIKIWAQNDLGIYLPYFRDAGYEEMIEQYKGK